MKIIKSIIPVILLATSSFAMSQTNEVEMAKEFNVKQLWLSNNFFYTIKKDERTIGNLVQRDSKYPLMYELFDAQNKRLTSVDYLYNNQNDHFDIYDDNHQLLGSTDEYLNQFFPAFNIYFPGSTAPVAEAKMNFWGTTFSIYDTETGKKMAEMTRSYFRQSNYWNFRVTNNHIFDAKNFPPKLWMTIIAIQADSMLYKTYHGLNSAITNRIKVTRFSVDRLHRKHILDRINKAQQKLNLTDIKLQNPDVIEKVVKELDAGFSHVYSNHNMLSEQEQFDAFLQYCFDKIESPDSSNMDREAILYLLKTQFQ